jgi:NOL1/NOP2/fmu family ribosome biogenesis protein
MFRKSFNARNEWSAELPYSCAIRQAGILEQAARMVKPGGTLAYTTCTFSPEENEGVIANFLNQHPDFKIKPIPIINGMRRAMPEWIGQSQDHVVRLADRIWPHLSQGEGHFIALFTKINTLHPEFDIKHLHEIDFRNKSSKQDKQTSMKLLDDFSNTYLNITFNKARLSMVGSYLYQLPEGSPDLSGLKVIHHGWWLGSIQKNRFTPSHALAIGMDMNDAKHRCSLKLNDQRATQYLHGESISDLGENGWTLITYDGFPLGWGKRVNNVIKNYYPHGLRRFI